MVRHNLSPYLSVIKNKQSNRHKTKGLTLLAALVLFSFTGYAQAYNELVNTAFEYLDKKDDKNLEETSLKLFPAYLKEQMGEYQEAVSAVENNHFTQAFLALEKIVADSILLAEVKADSHFTPLHKDKRWGSLMNKINKIESGYNLSIRNELHEINNSDQGIRLLLIEVRKKYGRESEEEKRVRSIMKKADDTNADKIQDIIDRAGWLGSDKVGYYGNQTYFLAIQHVEDTIVQKRYLPVLRKAVKEGRAEPWQYAFLQDRLLMNQGKPQIYGTQKIISADPEKSYLIPLQDPENVDELRAEVGLGPLQEELEEEGMNWNLEEYRKKLPETEKMFRERFIKLQSEEQEK